MASKKDRAFLRRSFVLSLILGALAFIPSAPMSAPVVEAQGRPDLEAQHQRLLPLFELAGVVFTDADETSGRLVVGVLDRDVEGLVRGRLRALGVASQDVDVVETDAIFALASLRDRAPDIQGGLQINFSQYLCSIGFIAKRNNQEQASSQPRTAATDKVRWTAPRITSRRPRCRTASSGTRSRIRHMFGTAQGARREESVASRMRTSAAVARSAPFSLGTIARTNAPGSGSLEIAGTFTIAGEGVQAIVGAHRRQGRTDDWLDSRTGQQYVREHRGLGHEHRPSLPDVRGKHRRRRYRRWR